LKNDKNRLTFDKSGGILWKTGKIDFRKGKKMESKITRFTKVILDIMYWGGLAVTATLPISIRLYGRINSYFERYYAAQLILFFLSGILAVLIIGELRRMFRTVLADDCFRMDNVVSLRRMGNYSFLIAAVTCFRAFMYLTPAIFVVFLVFVIAGLFSKVLSQVFEKAVIYKQENDLTI